MTYEQADEQPSIFFLAEDERQTIMTVFNWTNTARSHTLKLGDLRLPAGHTFAVTDVLNQNQAVTLVGGAVQIENQPPESVRVIKITDMSIVEAAPTVAAQVPSAAHAGEMIHVSAQTDGRGVPAVWYHWDFGDGESSDSPKASHCYTRAADFTIRLRVEGVDGVSAQQNYSVKVTGRLRATPNLTENRRFVEPTNR